MSYYLPELENEILKRVEADTGAGGMFETSGTNKVTGAFNTFAPATNPADDAGTAGKFPYIVYQITDALQDDAFNTQIENVEVRFHVYLAEQPTTSADQVSLARNIISRIRGDWSDQADRNPSFGFDRFKPTLGDTTWTADRFNFAQSFPLHEEAGVLHYVLIYNIQCSKAGA